MKVFDDSFHRYTGSSDFIEECIGRYIIAVTGADEFYCKIIPVPVISL